MLPFAGPGAAAHRTITSVGIDIPSSASPTHAAPGSRPGAGGTAATGAAGRGRRTAGGSGGGPAPGTPEGSSRSGST